MDQGIPSNTQALEILSANRLDDLFNESNLTNCFHVSDLWNGKIMKRSLTEETVSWILNLAEWKVSLTLTFRDETSIDVAVFRWRMLVRALNKELFGKHYTKIVKHSYFSYAYGIEYQKRDVIHFHAIIDKPVNFSKIHLLWNSWAGFAWTDEIRSKYDCVKYIAKYNLKGGQVKAYKAKKDYEPDVLPYWWKKAEMEQLDLFNVFSGMHVDREIESIPLKN